MAKIRVEVDLLKPLPQSVFVGQEYEDSPLKGYAQKLEYEGVLKYCKHCRKIEQEGRKVDESSNEKVPKLPSSENNQIQQHDNQQQEKNCHKISKEKKKKTKKKKTKKLPKKSKVVFKPVNSKRREENASATKQNDFSRQAIEESILSPMSKNNVSQKDPNDKKVSPHSSEKQVESNEKEEL
ncbi:protein PXR1-like [Nicotiana sylvestris]|uniref:protein PXR1-like n=1 Tax=Nicotiana sylvestris TaxID=4096 RepID=UPI00388CEA64